MEKIAYLFELYKNEIHHAIAQNWMKWGLKNLLFFHICQTRDNLQIPLKLHFLICSGFFYVAQLDVDYFFS